MFNFNVNNLKKFFMDLYFATLRKKEVSIKSKKN